VQASSELPTAWPLRHIPAPRRASVLVVGGILVAYFALNCYWELLFAHNPETWFPLAIWLARTTDGLINVTLAVNVPNQLILIVVLLIGLCGFRPREMGLDLTKLPAAVVLTVLFWLANQLVLVLVLLLISQPIVLNSEWTATGWTQAAGQWLGQLFGNTPLEEVVFRGFLLPQCLLLMLNWMPKARLGMKIAVALVLSQLLFVLFHVFFNLRQPQGQWLLLAQFVMGLAFAGVYLRTGNLFLAMGVHTLSNNVSPLIQEPFDGPGLGGGLIMLATLLAVVFGPSVLKVGRGWVSPTKPAAAAGRGGG
jgi:membrane protease YdiL (CAAX protease family)